MCKNTKNAVCKQHFCANFAVCKQHFLLNLPFIGSTFTVLFHKIVFLLFIDSIFAI